MINYVCVDKIPPSMYLISSKLSGHINNFQYWSFSTEPVKQPGVRESEKERESVRGKERDSLKGRERKIGVGEVMNKY